MRQEKGSRDNSQSKKITQKPKKITQKPKKITQKIYQTQLKPNHPFVAKKHTYDQGISSKG